jgi:hypothetical protein
LEKLLSRKRITKEYNLAKKTAGGDGGGGCYYPRKLEYSKHEDCLLTT